ncbi:Equilibrative nucleoside transporter 3 [Halotydeus destructor]|nr:Equilibrative nucleoside transporter 3 [Halotydeus destructor]
MLLLGVGTVLPWNMFINANAYFVDYKLPQSNDTQVTSYRNNFLSYLGVFSIGPNFVLQLWNLLYQTGCGSAKMRITVTSLTEMVLFAFTIALALMDSTEWPAAFFYLTMVSVVLINMASGVFQNSAMGIPSILPMAYTNAVVTGMNVGGTFASLASIISIAVSSGPKTAAILYFSIAVIYMAAIVVIYWTLDRNPFYRFYKEKVRTDDSTGNATPIAERSLSETIDLYKSVLSKCWVHCLNTYLVFFVTLSVFPAVQANITSVNDIFPKAYFAPMTTFLTFNLFASLGNILASDMFPKPGPRYLCIPVTLRLLFIPFFLLCNYQPLNGRSWAVWFSNDWVFWFGNMLMSISSGYLSSLSMMYAPTTVASEHASIAGMMAGFGLISGVFSGVIITFAWPALVG